MDEKDYKKLYEDELVRNKLKDLKRDVFDEIHKLRKDLDEERFKVGKLERRIIGLEFKSKSGGGD